MASRRSFLRALGIAPIAAILAAPGRVRARPAGRLPRIGFLANTVPLADLEKGTSSHPAAVEFLAGLRKLGWEDGRNVRIVWKSAEGRYDRLPQLAEELVRIPVDLIIAFGPGVDAAARATKTIPILMGGYYAPVENGLAKSLSRPGGNVTGVTLRAGEANQHIQKRLSLLKEVSPSLSRVTFVPQLPVPDSQRVSREARWLDELKRNATVAQALKSLGIELSLVSFREIGEVEAAIQKAVRQGAQALAFDDIPDLYYLENQRRIAEELRRHRLPAIHQVLSAAAQGALMAFGPDANANFRRVPHFVDRILQGANPGDIPIEQPAKVEFHVNLGAARAIGLTVPQSVLLQADRVFE